MIKYLTLLLLPLCVTNAFTPSLFQQGAHSSTTLFSGNIEQIEFKIFPDGRIEETVRGVKGGDCHKVTEDINKSLGNVVDSKPTEELYEEKITIDQTLEVNSNNDGGWESSW